MTQTNNEKETDIYMYKGEEVTVITVFTDDRNSTAIIEDIRGEILEVPRSELRQLIEISFSLSYINAYLITISTFSFLLYGYDKFQALKNSKNISRVSEMKLLLSSFLGGTIGSILSMLIFRHKIKKTSFIIKFLLVIITQSILFYIYFKGLIPYI